MEPGEDRACVDRVACAEPADGAVGAGGGGGGGGHVRRLAAAAAGEGAPVLVA